MFRLNPRHLKVGDEVAVVPGHMMERVRYQRVTRVNKVAVTLDDGTRWRARDGRPWGDGEWRRFSPFLDTPEAGHQRELEMEEGRRHKRAVRRFREAVTRFEREHRHLPTGQVERATAAIERAFGHGE